jgi:hypothetical protein
MIASNVCLLYLPAAPFKISVRGCFTVQFFRLLA